MQAPAPLAAKQWYTVLMRGGSFGIPFALGSALATAYVASQRKQVSLCFIPHVLTRQQTPETR
jgi:hypothetical protein